MAVEVRRDGAVQEKFASGDDTADHNAAFGYVLRHQPMSVDWACQYEGWAIVPVRDATAQPMKPGELGRYVCVQACLHSPKITVKSDGVWVRQETGPYGVTGTVSSAHRDCYEAWRIRTEED